MPGFWKLKEWDEYFMEIAKAVSKKSKCMSRQLGAIIVRDRSIISTGYNSPPRGVPECNSHEIGLYYRDRGFFTYSGRPYEECPRKLMGYKSGEGLEFCIAGHAERNAIVNAARMGISTKDSTIYCYCNVPCAPCLIEIINAGIKRIVCREKKFYDKMSEYLIKKGRLELCAMDNWFAPLNRL